MIESIVLRNRSTLQSIAVDKTRTTIILDEADLGTVPGTHHSYKYINQVGVFIESTTLDQRIVSFTGWVIGENHDVILENKKILNRLVNPLHEMEVEVYDTYKLVFKPDYSIQYSVPYRENNEVLCRFLIQGTCADPMFSYINEYSALIASIIPKFKFPLIIPRDTGILMGLREPSLLARIENPGDVDTGMIITFSCTSTVINPSLLNVNTRESLKINKILIPGEIIEVSTVAGNKYIRGTLDGVTSNYFAYWDFSSTWMQLHQGENVISYGADDNVEGLRVLITYSPKFLEVQ